MILVRRGPEPPVLVQVRDVELPRVRRIARRRLPTSDEIVGYDVVKDFLWKSHHYKCCYCESQMQREYNDVEHHRPKARAVRAPGSPLDHGYWWLAWTWENLLFSCPGCNRSGKADKFPLHPGSEPLMAEQAPPARERPLLVDPASEDGTRHIRFVLAKHGTREVWMPRGQTPEGAKTIEVCRLDRGELLDLYTRHVALAVWPEAKQVQEALHQGIPADIASVVQRATLRLLNPYQVYVGLSLDALRHFVPEPKLAPFGLRWTLISP